MIELVMGILNLIVQVIVPAYKTIWCLRGSKSNNDELVSWLLYWVFYNVYTGLNHNFFWIFYEYIFTTHGVIDFLIFLYVTHPELKGLHCADVRGGNFVWGHADKLYGPIDNLIQQHLQKLGIAGESSKSAPSSPAPPAKKSASPKQSAQKPKSQESVSAELVSATNEVEDSEQ